jgi:hypothetical protein
MARSTPDTESVGMATMTHGGRISVLRAQFLASEEGRHRLHRLDEARHGGRDSSRVDFLEHRLEEAFWRWLQFG